MQNGIDGNRIRHINNFAETEESTRPVDRAEFGVPAGAPLLLGLGRLHASKGFDTLIRAVAGLEGVYLWIAGEGPLRGELERLIRELGGGNRISLLGWRSDRAALFRAADLFVFSSRYEPFGTVFVQAWAQKIPLVSTLSDGPRQFVRDGWSLKKLVRTIALSRSYQLNSSAPAGYREIDPANRLVWRHSPPLRLLLY